MDVKVKLHFTGLCAGVPNKSIEKTDNEATILLVNSRHSHEPHHSILLSQPKYFSSDDDPNNRPYSVIIKPDKDQPHLELRVVPLGGEAMSLVGLTADNKRVLPRRNSLRFVTTPPVTQPCPDDGNAPNVAWICTNPGTLNPDVLTTMSRCDLIAVRLRLTEGTVESGAFRRVKRDYLGEKRVRWFFGDGPSRARTEEIIYTMTFPDAAQVVKVMFESASFENCPAQKFILLKPDPDDGLVEAFIANLPLGGLMSIDPPRPLDPDSHYGEFYRLCQETYLESVPVPDLLEFCEGAAAPSNPRCPPTLFAPASEAGPSTVEVHHPMRRA